MFKYLTLFFALLVLMATLINPASGLAAEGLSLARGGAVINLGPINPPNLGFGQSAQFNAYVSQNSRPIKNVRVEFWFSGQHGIQSAHWSVRSNAEGRATLSKAIPRDWNKQTKWVDLNVSCDEAGTANHWRIKN